MDARASIIRSFQQLFSKKAEKPVSLLPHSKQPSILAGEPQKSAISCLPRVPLQLKRQYKRWNVAESRRIPKRAAEIRHKAWNITQRHSQPAAWRSQLQNWRTQSIRWRTEPINWHTESDPWRSHSSNWPGQTDPRPRKSICPADIAIYAESNSLCGM